MNNDFNNGMNQNNENNYTPDVGSYQGAMYTETIKKPKREKKKFYERTFLVVIITALATSFLTSALFGVTLLYHKDRLKNAILKDIQVPTEHSKELNIPGAAPASVSTGALSNQEIAAMVSPSIVGISNMSFVPNSLLNINSLQSTGSGIIISEDGYIVTNNHVISNANKLKVTLSTGDELEAKLIGSDPETDMAIIKVDPTGHELKAAVIGNSSSLQVGDSVLAIGNPLGLQLAGSVTHGIVSAVNRKLTIDGTTYNLIQTDAAINSGNSGGALVNTAGEVIGINSVKIASDGIEGLGFAIPIDDVKNIIEDLIEDGYVHGRPSFGINVVEVTPQIAYYYDLPTNYGLFVNDVLSGGSADLAGIEVGDIIIAFNDEKVSSTAELIDKRNSFVAGDTIKLTINRDGREKTFTVTLQEDKPTSIE